MSTKNGRHSSRQTRQLTLRMESLEDRRLLAAADLRITELNYNPYEPLTQFGEQNVDNDQYEFLEIANFGNTATALDGIQFVEVAVGDDAMQGISMTFSAGTVLAPGERGIIVRNASAFQTRYGADARILGNYSGALSNGGERVAMMSANNVQLQQFDYNDGGAWPGRADGNGSSLEIIDPNGDYDDPDNWRSSSEFGGSPGVAGNGPTDNVLINEVLANSELPDVDTIELVNTTSSDIDISSWYISDSNNDYLKFRVPEQTVLSANGHVVFDESDFNPDGTTLRLSSFGDDIWLLSGAASGRPSGFMDRVGFQATFAGQAVGRIPDAHPDSDLVPMATLSQGRENVGHNVSDVIISEVHYNPSQAPDFGFEFVELYNTTASSLDIGNLRLDNAVDFDFAEGTTIPAGGSVVVVDFSPNDIASANAFRSAFGITPTVTLLGPWSTGDTLGNGGERIQLEQRNIVLEPGESDFDFVVLDQVDYDDESPWPSSADSGGNSLHRVSPVAMGNQPTSFLALAPTPGNVDFSSAIVGDLNGDNRVTATDVDVLFAAINSASQVHYFDLTEDGSLDNADALSLVETVINTNLGDANLDGKVDFSDFTILSNNFNSNRGSWSKGDFNGDGDVDFSDFNSLASNFGFTAEIAADNGGTGGVAADAGNMRITEINYNPHDSLSLFGEDNATNNDDYEFIEVSIVGASVVDLENVKFVKVDVEGDVEGIEFAFPAISLHPGTHAVVVRNEAAFKSRFGNNVPIAGQWTGGGLGNGGERITLLDASNQIIQQFDYDDSGDWPGRADGNGSTLEIIDPAGSYIDPLNWRSSVEFAGSPGVAGDGPTDDVLINEVLTHTDLPVVDQIELHNTTANSIDISGWYLSDLNIPTEDLFKIQIPDNTTIAAGGYVVLDEMQFGPSAGPNGFALSEFGDEVWLTSVDINGQPSKFMDRVRFGATFNSVSLGRLPNATSDNDLVPLNTLSLGGSNALQYQADLIVSEIHYNPMGEDLGIEFIEITNLTEVGVNLSDWRVRGVADVDFPSLIVEGNGAIVLVDFAPADAVKANAFRTAHGIDASVVLFGPWDRTDNLDDDGATVTLQLRNDELAPGADSFEFLELDRIDYEDAIPWPTSADGGGNSLHRKFALTLGVAASSWIAAPPTPGTPLRTQPADFSQNGHTDADDIDELFTELNANGTSPLFDLDSDGTVSVNDLDVLIGDILQTKYGDSNLDGVVDFSDFVNLANGFGNPGMGWSGGNFNGDADVNFTDFVILANNFG